MSVIYVCDGCGKQHKADKAHDGTAIKPRNWYARGDEDGEQHSCSRECIKTTAEKSGKTDLVLPI